MENYKKIIDRLKKLGGRTTPVRQALIKILIKNKKPLAPRELLLALQKKGFAVNKTTIYRQLEALRDCGIVYEINFNDRVKHYELADGGHHHHLVCTQCQQIEDVILPANLEPQKKIIKMISNDKKFMVMQHSLEFFGVCQQCQGKNT